MQIKSKDQSTHSPAFFHLRAIMAAEKALAVWQPGNIENNADVKSGREHVGHLEGNEVRKVHNLDRAKQNCRLTAIEDPDRNHTTLDPEICKLLSCTLRRSAHDEGPVTTLK